MNTADLGYDLPRKEVSWLQRDALLFANSIGARADEPHFLYELHPGFAVFPTYPLILPFKLTDQEVVYFYGRNVLQSVPGAPPIDIRGAVDGQRTLTVHRPLPTSSQGRTFELRNRVVGIYDKGSSGSSFATQQQIVDAGSGEVYATTQSMNFLPGQGNWGGPRGPKSAAYPLPSRSADAVHEVQTDENTVFLYRLNGDSNPLHADPAVGQKLGFGGTIVHGLFTYSSACHGLLRELYNSDASRLRQFHARFSSPVRPGDRLTTDMWRVGVTEDGLEEVRFKTTNQKGTVVLSNGRALFHRQVIRAVL